MKKRLCSLLLVASIILNMIVTVMADGNIFTPGQEYSHKYEAEAVAEYINKEGVVSYIDIDDYSVVGILGHLGIMTEYNENHEFKPNVFISRAEMTDAVVKLIDCKDIPVSKHTAVFYDLPNDHKYADSVYAACERNIVSGYGDNSFKPDTTISYNEAVCMIVRALGYDMIAANTSQYIRIANNIGITKGVNVEHYEALTRMEVAKLLSNSLEAPLLSVTYSSIQQITVERDETLLKNVYKLKKYTGHVTGNIYTNIDGGEKCSNERISIDGIVYEDKNNKFCDYLGYDVVYYCDEDEAAVYMYKSKKIEELKISCDDMDGYSNNVLRYRVGNKSKKVTLSEDFDLLYNGLVPKKSYTEDIFNIKTGRIRLVANDGSDYDTVFIEEYENFVISAGRIDNDELSLTFQNGVEAARLDLTETAIRVYTATGSEAEVVKEDEQGQVKYNIAALKAGNVASIYSPYAETLEKTDNYGNKKKIPYNASFVKIVLSDKTVVGKAASINNGDNEITIGEDKYLISENNYFDEALKESIRRAEQTFLLDVDDKIVGVSIDSKTAYKYGYIVKVIEDKLETGYIQKVKILTSTGKVAVLNANEKLRINTKRAKEKGMEILRASAKLTHPEFDISQVIKYKTEDTGETITDIITVTKNSGEFGKESLNFDKAMDTYQVTADTAGILQKSGKFSGDYSEGMFFKPNMYFQVPAQENMEDDYYNVVSFAAKSGFSAEAYDVENLTPNLMVIYNTELAKKRMGNSNNDNDDYVFAYIDHKVMLNDDNEIVCGIEYNDGFGNFECYSDDLSICDKLEKGDLAMFFVLNDKVVDIIPVCMTDTGEKLNYNNLPDINSVDELSTTAADPQYGAIKRYGEIYSKDGSKIVIQYGPIVSGNKRQYQFTGYLRNNSWQMGGKMLIDATGNEPIFKSATTDDLRTVEEFGSEYSTKVLCSPIDGNSRYFIFINK